MFSKASSQSRKQPCFNPFEAQLFEAGFIGLACTMCEARSEMVPSPLQHFEMVQYQANFPFLFLSSLILHRKIICDKTSRLLMCSRDSVLWQHVQRAVMELHTDGRYDIQYLYTSRLARYFPSDEILSYTNAVINSHTLIVDICGSGRSLASFIAQLRCTVPLWLIVGYFGSTWEEAQQIPHAIAWEGRTTIELANLAQHAMIVDVAFDSNGTYIPVFRNPTQVEWAAVPEIKAMHEALQKTLVLMSDHSFDSDIRVDNRVATDMLRLSLGAVDRCAEMFDVFTHSFFGEEEQSTRAILRKHGIRP